MRKKENDEMNKKFLICAVLLMPLVFAGRCALAAETVSSLNSKLIAAIEEKRKLQRQNPSVVYIETDNPAKNIQKTSDQMGGRYPVGVTRINKNYHCPYCKASTAESEREFKRPDGTVMHYNTDFTHRYNCTKGQFDEKKWRDMVKKVEETEEYDRMIAKKEEEIEELKKTIEEVKKGRDSNTGSKSPATGSADAFTAEKFDGIFSMKFGTGIDTSSAGKAEFDNTYLFEPKKKFRYFNEYSCTVSPRSKKVFAIRARITADNAAGVELSEEQGKVIDLLERKYGIKAVKLSPSEYRMDFKNAAGKTARKIFVTSDSIVAVDVDMRKSVYKDINIEGKPKMGGDMEAL